MKKKLKGFTLIELIVVIAIIGVLAAILVPSMMGFLREAKAARMNSNARTAYSAGQAAVSDILARGGVRIIPGGEYIGTGDGVAHPADGNGDDIFVGNYLGEDFEGYFAFKIDDEGSSCLFGLWCDVTYPSDIRQYTYDEVVESISSAQPIGCHPVAVTPVSDD